MLNDPEFGEVIIRRNSRSRSVSFSISTSGRLQATVPSFVSAPVVKKTLEKMRDQIRQKLKVKDPATQRARDLKKKLLTKQAKNIYLTVSNISLNALDTTTTRLSCLMPVVVGALAPTARPRFFLQLLSLFH